MVGELQRAQEAAGPEAQLLSSPILQNLRLVSAGRLAWLECRLRRYLLLVGVHLRKRPGGVSRDGAQPANTSPVLQTFSNCCRSAG